MSGVILKLFQDARVLVLVLCLIAPGAGVVLAAGEQTKTGPSGLPLPRFVSLKADKVNVRKGPSRNHPVTWVFKRQGLPVEVIAEFDHWRRVRDSDGAEGWIFHSLLSGRRTGVIAPWAKDETFTLHHEPEEKSPVIAQLKPGVTGSVAHCTGSWCQFNVGDYSGGLKQDRLWGVYPDETFK